MQEAVILNLFSNMSALMTYKRRSVNCCLEIETKWMMDLHSVWCVQEALINKIRPNY